MLIYYKNLEDLIDGKETFDAKTINVPVEVGAELWLTDGAVKMLGIVGQPDPITGAPTVTMQRGTYQCCHE